MPPFPIERPRVEVDAFEYVDLLLAAANCYVLPAYVTIWHVRRGPELSKQPLKDMQGEQIRFRWHPRYRIIAGTSRDGRNLFISLGPGQVEAMMPDRITDSVLRSKAVTMEQLCDCGELVKYIMLLTFTDSRDVSARGVTCMCANCADRAVAAGTHEIDSEIE